MEIFPVTTVDEILAGLGYLIQANYEVLALLLATIIAIVFVVRWFIREFGKIRDDDDIYRRDRKVRRRMGW